MTIAESSILLAGGLISGILAGLLGIGGGTILVPFLVTSGNSAIQSVATSSLAIIITSISGSVQNWRMGYLDAKKIIYLGIPAILTAQIGAIAAVLFPEYILLISFALLLLTNIYLVELRKKLEHRMNVDRTLKFDPIISRVITGGTAGLLAGLLGVGGGVIMVPLQMLLLGEPIKLAIQTSLGTIVITAISATVGHAIAGNVLFAQGIILGIGGFLGAQISTRALPKLPDHLVSQIFRSFLALLSVYLFWQAWIKYPS